MDIWSLLALQLLALAGGVLTGVGALLLGGAGSLRVLANRLELLEERQDHTDDRVTSEVKKRAAQVSVDKREAAKSVEDQATELLAAAAKPPARQSAKRPSVMGVP